MTQPLRKVLSLVLALTLVLGLAPVRAAAEGTSPRYISLAQCPSFTLRGPEGVYPLEQYSNNAMVLVFGRITCGNTQALLSQLNGMVDSLAEQGIQVFANMEYTFQPEDFSAIRSAYPNITYTYGDDMIRTRLLDLVDPHLDGFVFPVVFVIDRNGSIIYYSTGYVSDMEPLLTKAEAAATNQPLPDPQPWDDRFYGSLYNYTGDDAALEDYIHQELLKKNPYISAYDSVWTGSMDIWQGEDLAYAMFDVLEGDVEEYGPYTVPDTWVYYTDARQVLIILEYPDDSVTPVVPGEATDPENIEGTESTDPIDPDATDPGNVTWDLSDGVLTVSGTGAMEDHSMPWFDLREEIRSVVIEEGITYVGAYAFYECPNLTQVTLPLSVTAMGDQAFSDCPVETSYYAGAPSQWELITQNNSGPWNSVVYCEKAGRDLTWDFADGVLTVSGAGEMDGFSNMTIAPWEGLKSRIETVVIREGVTSVNPAAFQDCTALTAVTIPKTVIELNVFGGENSLQAITVDQDNPAYTSEDGILFNKDKTVLIQYPCQKADTYYRIPEGVTEIGNEAFANSDNLTRVTFPESLCILGHFAFMECDGLRHVIIPGHVTELGYSSFLSCTGLESVEVESGITDLPMFMFEGCASLEEVTLPDTLINIWENTFAYCTSLKRLKLPAGMNFISDGAFHDSTALEEIIIGGVREIYWPIGGCTALKKVIFLGDAPGHCEQAFYEATLTAYYPAGNATWTDAVRESFGGNVTWIAMAYSGTCGDDLTWSFDNGTLTISGTGDMYDYSGDQTNPAPWAQFGDDMEILVVEEGVTGIGDNAFDGCAIMEGHFPGTLVSVGDSAGLRGLAYINQTVRRWSKIDFGENNTGFPWWDAARFVVEDPIVKSGKAGEHIYWELDKDGILVFFGNGEMYDFGATASPFAESSVKTVTIGEGITNIGANLLETWGSSALGKTLESVTVASSVTRVETMAFTDCKALKTVTFTGDAPSFGENCFRGVTATAYYPADNATWTAAVMQDYEGDITWLPYTHEHTFGEWITEDNLSTRTCALCGYMEQKVTTDSGDVELELPDQPGLNADVVPVRPSDSDYVLVEEALNSAEEPNQKILKVFDINLKNSDGVHVQPDGAVKVKLPLDWEKEGNYKVYRVNDDGTLTDMNAYRQGSHMVFETDHFSLYVMVEVYEDNPFEDVALDQWYAASVLWAVNQGITNGMTETTFAPDGTCTRAQIVTFLWRANGSPAPASANNPFTDVPAGQWYTDAVLWAVEKGITTGTSATTFSPDAGCTRGQVATFLWRAEGEPASGAENIFTDIASGAYYYDAVLWAVENEITNGMGEGIFAPDATCTRGQIVTFLYRAMTE